jgi:hypothetical protein
LVPPASAAEPDNSGQTQGHAETRGQGVDIGVEGTRPGSDGATSRARGRVGLDSHGQPCSYHTSPEPLSPVNYDGTRLVELTDTPPPDPADQLYILWCNDDFVALRWFGPGTPTPEVGAALEQLLDRLDVQAATVEVRPDTAGLVGVPAYAWLTGDAVGPLTDSITLPGFGTIVAVEARLTSVSWDFGDGTPPLQAGPGAPWPARTDVHHVYAVSSAPARPYPVTATATYTPTFTVNGVDGGPLAPVTVTLTRTYPVRELEAVRQR